MALLATFLACSSSSLIAQPETVVTTGVTWRFVKGTDEASNPAGLWRERTFNDSTWTLGPAPFHYGEGLNTGTLLSDMRGLYTCIYLRRAFVVTNVAEVTALRITDTDDDGFIAWVNGTEVFRARVNGQATHTSIASSSHEALPAETFTDNSPYVYLVPGTNILAVQAFNRDLSASTDFRFDASLEIIKTDLTPLGVSEVAPPPESTVAALNGITISFSKPVYGVDAEDLRINGQVASAVAGAPGATSYTFTFTQPPPGLVAVEWDDAPGISDSAGRLFDPALSGADWTYTLSDTAPPDIAEFTPVPGAAVSHLTQVELAFTEPVRGVDAGDLLVNGAPAASVTGSESGPYIFQFAQPASGQVQFSWSDTHGISDAAVVPNAFGGTTWTVTLAPETSAADVVVNEFVAAIQSGLADEDGEPQDWIELFNRGSSPVNLLGWSLTDSAGLPGKWTFPSRNLNPGQYLVVFASGKDRRNPTGQNRFHTNFRLNPLGEYLALFNPESPRVAVSEFEPQFPEQRNNYSYGLDGSNTWRYFDQPTPGAQNGASAITGIVPPPTFGTTSGMFEAPFALELSSSLEGALIRYTTNGSEPTFTTGFTYSAPLQIAGTTVIRAAAFAAGRLPSRTETHSFIFLDQVIDQPNNPPGFPADWGVNSGFPGGRVPADYEMDKDPLRRDPNDPSSPIEPQKLQRLKDGLRELPILSIVMKTDDMFGAGGLYPTSSDSNKSPNQKPCSLELLLPDGASAFSTTCGIGLHGNASRNPLKSPKHGFKLVFKGDFGESSLKYRLFPESPANDFDDLVLRPDFNTSWLHWSDSPGNGAGAYQRTRATRIRDGWVKRTLRDMGNVASHTLYCHAFINGLYWGIYDFTEQPTEHFGAAYLGGTTEDFDVYDQGVLQQGTPTAYNAMVSISNLADDANYALMRQYLDVPEFIDYMLLHFFIGHQDWGNAKNWYAIRRRVSGPGGTFKYLPWDGECVLLDEDVNRVPNGGGSTDVPSGLHTKLDDNAEYRLEFADHVFKHLVAPGGALTPAANIARWQKALALMDDPIVAESSRWGDYRRDVHRYQDGAYVLYTRENQWLAENARLVSSYFPGRTKTVLNQLRAASLYPSVEAPLFNQEGGHVLAGFNLTMSAPAGTIYFTTNGVDPRIYGNGAVSPQARPYDSPVALRASTIVKARAFSAGAWSALNETTFTVADLVVPLRFSEVMYNPPGGDAYEYVELMNIGPLPIDISGYSFQGIGFILPDNTVLQPGATLLMASSADPPAFQAHYPNVSIFGYFDGQLSNGGERLAVLDRDRQTVTALHYDDENGWPAGADGGGFSIEIVDPRGDPNAPANWRASSLAGGTPGLPPTTPTLASVVLNEIMAENVHTLTNGDATPDWIELGNTSSNAVSLAGWSLTDDSDWRKFVFPPGASIAVGAFLVVWCDSATNAPGLHTGFKLNKEGESLFLFDTSTNRADALTFGLQLPDLSVGRIVSDWQLTLPTPGSNNVPAPLASPTELTINEWLANAAPGEQDWLELFNQSPDAPISLHGCYLGTSNALFQVNALSFLGPLEFAQLYADEGAGPNHLEFKLPAAGGAITLYDPAGVQLEQVTYGPQATGVSEGRLPDGSANIVSFPSTPSPGQSNHLFVIEPPILSGPFRLEGGEFSFSLTDQPNLTYVIESSADLLQWQEMQIIIPTNSPATIVLPALPQNRAGFFRVRIAQ